MRPFLIKIKKIAHLNGNTFLLLLESFLLLLLAQFCLKSIQFERLTKCIGKLNHPHPVPPPPVRPSDFGAIGDAIEIVSRNVGWQVTCYPKALCAKWMLRLRGYPSTLYLGVKRDAAGRLAGHAWLGNSAGFIVGGDGSEEYKVIATYT